MESLYIKGVRDVAISISLFLSRSGLRSQREMVGVILAVYHHPGHLFSFCWIYSHALGPANSLTLIAVFLHLCVLCVLCADSVISAMAHHQKHVSDGDGGTVSLRHRCLSSSFDDLVLHADDDGGCDACSPGHLYVYAIYAIYALDPPQHLSPHPDEVCDDTSLSSQS